jgi:Ca2+-binding EF-hand superfamily protein
MKKNITIATAIAASITLFGASLCHAEDAPKKAPNPQKKFEKIDTDKNGSISLEEFKAHAKNPDKAEKKFTKLDTDKNGSLSLAEFSANPPKKPKAGQ